MTTHTVRPGALTQLLADLARAPEGGAGWDVPPEPGQFVGRFEILREIGRGGFGVVYEARDTELQRTVAFKAIRPGSSDATREARALAEAEAAARLAHPNIVHLYDVGRSEQGAYLIMELLRGKTLAECLSEGPLPLREAVRVAVEISRGLAHAHSQGVVHRDLKPSNVFLCNDGQVKVLDFGLAHVFGRGGLAGGTPAYMSPEQARGEAGDERSDVYSLGVLVAELVAGAKAPAALEKLVARMKEQDPASRPSHAGEVHAALAVIQRALEPRRLFWASWVVAGVAAGVAIGLAAWPRLPPGRLLAVLADVENATGEPAIDGLGEIVRAALGQSGRVALMDRSRAVDLLRQGGSPPARIGDEAARKVATRAGAQVVVVPAVRRAQGSYAVTLRGIDAARGTTVFSVEEAAATLSTLAASLERAVREARRALREQPDQAPAAPVPVEAFAPASLEALLAHGEAARLQSEGDFRGAVASLRKAIAADPGFLLPRLDLLEHGLWMRGGAGRMEDREREEHLAAIRRGLDRLPARERAWAEFLALDGTSANTSELLRLLDRAIEASPEDPRPHMLAAAIHLLHRGDRAPGLPHVERADVLAPHDNSFPDLLPFLRAVGRPDAALARARHRAEQDPTADALADLAELQRASGDLEGALATARRASRGFLSNPKVFMDAGALEEAEVLLAAEGRPGPRRQWLATRGRVREAVANLPVPLGFFDGFLALSRQDPRAVWAEAEAMFRVGPPVPGWGFFVCDGFKLAALGSVERAERLLSLAGERFVCERMARAILLWRKGEAERALEDLADIAVPSSHLYAAEVLSGLGRDREAVERLRTYRRSRGYNQWDSGFDAYHYPRSLYLEAAALERLGEREEARKALDRLLHLWERADPDLPLLAEAKSLQKRLGATSPRK